MSLGKVTENLISKLVKVTNDKTEAPKETTVYGTVVKQDDGTFVIFDGSDRLTPVNTTSVVKDGDRVKVTIKNHTATITGNITAPSARGEDVDKLSVEVDKISKLTADMITVELLEAERARIDSLESDNVVIKNSLEATNANIEQLNADNITINQTLVANSADISKLEADIAKIDAVSTEDLEAINADIHNLEATYTQFEQTVTKDLEAVNSTITNLDTEYANIDFSNIGKAAMEYFYAESGLIQNVAIGDATISGELVGVTIRGDRLIGGTVVADKLVIMGDDGLYYKLNFDGGTFKDGEVVPTDSLHGSVITANSITAEKITVDDLVALDATIGGFNITENSIYSGVKESIDNTTRGIYLGNDGQVALGDSNNFIKYYKDTDNKYKLAISADSIIFNASGVSVEDAVTAANANAASALSSVQDLEARADSGEFKGEKGDKGETGATGPQGEQGIQGERGNGIGSTSISYARNSSATSPPTSGWTSSIPNNSYAYLWTRTIITYTNGTRSTSYSVARNGNNGDDGVDGVGISSIVTQYYLSSSNTTQTGGSWSDISPVWSEGKYIWVRNFITWTDETTSTTDPVLDNALNDLNEQVTEAKASIEVNKDNIELKVSKGEVVSAINQSAETVKIKASKIALEGTVTANNNFKVLTDGSIEAKNGKFTGEIVSDNATITGGSLEVSTDDGYKAMVTVKSEDGKTRASVAPSQISLAYGDEYDEFNYRTFINAVSGGGYYAFHSDNGSRAVRINPASLELGADATGGISAPYFTANSTGVKTSGELQSGGVIYGGSSIHTNGKTATGDGKSGISLGAGTANIVHATGGGQLRFFYAGASSYTSRIYEAASGLLHFNGIIRAADGIRVNSNGSTIKVMRCGSTVVTPKSTTSVKLFNHSTVAGWYSGATNSNTAVFVSNGDGANAVHVEGATYNTDGAWYAVFDSSTSSSVRINYLVVVWD